MSGWDTGIVVLQWLRPPRRAGGQAAFVLAILMALHVARRPLVSFALYTSQKICLGEQPPVSVWPDLRYVSVSR